MFTFTILPLLYITNFNAQEKLELHIYTYTKIDNTIVYTCIINKIHHNPSMYCTLQNTLQ